DEIQLLPKRVELMLLLRIENQFVERRVVAEISDHEVEPRAEQSSSAFLIFLEKNKNAFRHVESVGEDFAETCERRLVTRPRSFTCGDDQGLVGHGVGHGSVLVCGAGDLQRAAMVTHAVRCVLAILPEHKRLGTGGYSTDCKVLEFRFQFL